MPQELKTISAVIPAYNESATIVELINRFLAVELGLKKEIVVVNDASQDNTWELLQQFAKDPRFKLINNQHNLGKSQSVKRGLLATTGDIVVIQDADLEYDPRNLVDFVNLIKTDKADLVYGNRFGKNNKVIYLQNWLGNSFLSLVSAIFTGPRAGMWPRDMEVCYKMSLGTVFRELAEQLVSVSMFGLEPELTARFSKYRKANGKHLRFAQVAIDYFPRSIAAGKKMHAVRDGLKALWEIIRFNLGR